MEHLISGIAALRAARLAFRLARKPLLVDECQQLIEAAEDVLADERMPRFIRGLNPLPGLVEGEQ